MWLCVCSLPVFSPCVARPPALFRPLHRLFFIVFPASSPIFTGISSATLAHSLKAFGSPLFFFPGQIPCPFLFLSRDSFPEQLPQRHNSLRHSYTSLSARWNKSGLYALFPIGRSYN